jgi:hypothetical protein
MLKHTVIIVVSNFGFRFTFEPKFWPKPKDGMIPKPKCIPKPKFRPKPIPKPKVSDHYPKVLLWIKDFLRLVNKNNIEQNDNQSLQLHLNFDGLWCDKPAFLRP